jgi:hypothetical protein
VTAPAVVLEAVAVQVEDRKSARLSPIDLRAAIIAAAWAVDPGAESLNVLTVLDDVLDALDIPGSLPGWLASASPGDVADRLRNAARL